MRKCFLQVLAVVFSGSLFSQSNNPYDQQGLNYVNSLGMISADFYAGKVKDFNEAALNYYSKQVPLRNQASVEMAVIVINTMKAPAFSYTDLVNKSSLSAFSKNTIKGIIDNNERLDDAGYRSNLGARTNAVLMADIPSSEKEFVLSLIAVAYHTADTGVPGPLANERQRGCWINGPYGSGPGTQAQCIAAGALIGGVIGYGICGVLCGLGGAIIGGVAGALS